MKDFLPMWYASGQFLNVIGYIGIIRWAGSFVSYLKFIEKKMSGYQQYGKAIL